jgi:ABC-type antimicrobial peptide transport system permease subunit
MQWLPSLYLSERRRLRSVWQWALNGRAGIARLVLISGAKLALLGCGLGVISSLSISRMVSAFLFAVSATDPLIYAGSIALMLLVALLASAQPAIRAASADPTSALRAN